MKKSPTPKSLNIKNSLATRSYPHDKKMCFWGITVSPEIGIL
jgi:hypothetical protein